VGLCTGDRRHASRKRCRAASCRHGARGLHAERTPRAPPAPPPVVGRPAASEQRDLGLYIKFPCNPSRPGWWGSSGCDPAASEDDLEAALYDRDVVTE
jgi:hypothetical protein